jgi:hypothetical protein
MSAPGARVIASDTLRNKTNVSVDKTNLRLDDESLSYSLFSRLDEHRSVEVW